MFGRMLLVAVSMILGFLYDATVWGRPTTVAFPFFVFVSMLGGFYTLNWLDDQPFPHWRSALLSVPPLVFSTTAWLTALQPESLRYRLSLVFTFLYLLLLSMTYLGGRLHDYNMFDYLQNFWRLARALVQQPVEFVQQWVRAAPVGAGADANSINYSRSVGWLSFVSLTGLLALANSVFWNVYGYWFDSFFNGSGDTSLFRSLLFSYLILGFFLFAGTQSQDRRLTGDDLDRYFITWLNYDRSILVLIYTIIPVTAFNVLRFFVVIDPGHYRDEFGMPAWINQPFGFWYLVAASVIVFLVVCWLNHVTVYNDARDRLVHSIVHFYLFFNVGLILWVAFFGVSRLTFGITATRHIYYAWGALVWMVIIFSMFIFLVYFQQDRYFPFLALVVTTVLVLMFIVLAMLFGAAW